ncbi:OB-fold nucleic acid binding domain-containing protein, partial [Francisella tularensis subsp. holarctica]|uniref:OB-fold nucleic acid binding domain-containing protein n=1 Tax=Francisella tularensis TaxID=263 RepID=UPI002381B894
DHGGVFFLDIIDRYGFVQLVFNTDNDNFKVADSLRSEFLIKAEGVVNLIQECQENKNISSGKVEIIGDSIEVIKKSK